MFEGFEEPDNETRSELLNEAYERFFTEDYQELIKERYDDEIELRKIGVTKKNQSHQFGVRISKDKSKSTVIPHYYIEFNEYSGLKVGFQFSNWGSYTPSFQIFKNAAEKNQKIIDDFIYEVFDIIEWIQDNDYAYKMMFPYNIANHPREKIEKIVNKRIFQESPYPSFKLHIIFERAKVEETPEFKNELIDLILLFKPLHDYCHRIINENTTEEGWDTELEDVIEIEDQEINILGFSEDMINEFINALESQKAIIFYGPPGTSKTYFASEFASQYVDDQDQFKIVQFHPSFSYEDFIAGIEVNVVDNQITYNKSSKIFTNFCKNAAENPKLNYILVIDEINRGNVSTIFGELINLIEKRGLENAIEIPNLPDDMNPYYIPKNVYIIGTMNTSDRSIAFLDFALRRRFYFFDFKPNSEILSNWLQENCPDENTIETISKIFEILNKKLLESQLDENFQLGHTYFMCKDLNEFKRRWNYSIMPLLKQYFYDDMQQLEKFNKVYSDFLGGKEEEDFEDLETEENDLED